MGASADHCARPVAVESLGLARIDEADTFDGHLSAAVGGNEPWRRIKDEGVEEAVGLVVAGVALSVGGELYFQDIRFGVLRHLAPHKLAAYKVTFGIDVLVRMVTETAAQVSTVIVALKAGASKLDSDDSFCLDVAVAWCDGSDMWGCIVLEAGVGSWILDIDPVLVVQRDLEHGSLGSPDCWRRPCKRVDLKLIRSHLCCWSQLLFAGRVHQPGPKAVSQVCSVKHEAITLD